MQLGGNKNKRAVKWWNPWISMLHFPLLALSGNKDGPACSHCQLCPFSQLTTLGGCEIFLHIFQWGEGAFMSGPSANADCGGGKFKSA